MSHWFHVLQVNYAYILKKREKTTIQNWKDDVHSQIHYSHLFLLTQIFCLNLSNTHTVLLFFCSNKLCHSSLNSTETSGELYGGSLCEAKGTQTAQPIENKNNNKKNQVKLVTANMSYLPSYSEYHSSNDNEICLQNNNIDDSDKAQFIRQQQMQQPNQQQPIQHMQQNPYDQPYIRHSRAFRHFKNPPQPHMCIKDRTDDGQELFINVMSWTKICMPHSDTDPIPLYGGMRVSIILAWFALFKMNWLLPAEKDEQEWLAFLPAQIKWKWPCPIEQCRILVDRNPFTYAPEQITFHFQCCPFGRLHILCVSIPFIRSIRMFLSQSVFLVRMFLSYLVSSVLVRARS